MKYFDLHCDTISECYHGKKSLFDNDFHLSLHRGEKYFPWFQCFAIWITDDRRGKAATDYFDALLQKFTEEIERNSDKIMLCKTASDFQTAQAQHKIGAVLTVEGGAAAAGNLERLKFMAECGVKVMTLTWNSSCEFGDGVGVESPEGLTPFGKLALKEMERLNMIVDVSHASSKLFSTLPKQRISPLLQLIQIHRQSAITDAT